MTANSGDKRLALFLAAACVLVWAAAVYLWNRDRMEWWCLLPKFGSDENSRWAVLLRHSPTGGCGALSREKHWTLAEKMSAEWSEARVILALKHAYGDYFETPAVGGFLRPFRRAERVMQSPKEPDERMWLQVNNELGDGEDLNHAKSLELLTAAAEDGNALAQEMLSFAYYAGEWGKGGKVKKDIKLSTTWLEKSANEGENCEAAYFAGRRWRRGVGDSLPQNWEKARLLFSQAAEKMKGEEFSEFLCFNLLVELAEMKALGLGGAADRGAAEDLLNRASRLVDRARGLSHYDAAARRVKNKRREILREE